MKKKLLMSLVLLIAVGTSAVFAQRAGETLQVGGQTYRVESNSNGRLVLQLVPSLDGRWLDVGSGNILTISGSTAVYSAFVNMGPIWDDARNKGYVKAGDQIYRNIRNTGNLTWSLQWLVPTSYTSNPNVCIGTTWQDSTIKLDPDGNTFTLHGSFPFRRVVQ